MSVAAFVNTGLSAAASAAVANFTSNLTALARLPQSYTNGKRMQLEIPWQTFLLMSLAATRRFTTWYASSTKSSDELASACGYPRWKSVSTR